MKYSSKIHQIMFVRGIVKKKIRENLVNIFNQASDISDYLLFISDIFEKADSPSDCIHIFLKLRIF